MSGIQGDPSRDYAAEWRCFRTNRGWTQAEMALTLGITRRTIINIEMGHTRPRLGTREKMNALNKMHREAKETSW